MDSHCAQMGLRKGREILCRPSVPGKKRTLKNKWFSRFNMVMSNNKHKLQRHFLFLVLLAITRNRDETQQLDGGWSSLCPFFITAAVLPNRLSVFEALNYFHSHLSLVTEEVDVNAGKPKEYVDLVSTFNYPPNESIRMSNLMRSLQRGQNCIHPRHTTTQRSPSFPSFSLLYLC